MSEPETLPTEPFPTVPVGPVEAPVDAAAEIAGLTGLLNLAVGVVVVATLFLARDVLVPIMVAILLSFVLSPLVALLRRLHLPRPVAVLSTVVLAIGVIGFLAAVIGFQLRGLAAEAPRFASNVEQKISVLRNSSIGNLPKYIGKLGRQFDRASGGTPALTTPREAARAGQPLQVELHEPRLTPIGIIKSVLGPVLGPLENTIIVVIFAIFILLQREDLRDRLIRLLGSTDIHRTTTAMDDAAARLGRYFVAQLALNTCFAVVIATGLYFIGVPSPVLWGLLAGLLRFVPYIGAFLSAIPPLVLAASTGSDWSMAVAVAVLFAAGEGLMGYAVEPLVYGHSTGLSPAAVIVAAVFWTWLWGPVGLVLSTPLTLILVVLGRHFERLEFLHVLLGDTPALSPVERFYQRLLAGDADDLLDQAERTLAQRPLASYYDDIAMPGLRLAAQDAERGILGGKRIDRVRKAAVELLADLGSHAASAAPMLAAVDGARSASRLRRGKAGETSGDAAMVVAAQSSAQPAGLPAGLPTAVPAAWQQAGAVLCIAGRSFLDDGAATIAAQLLGANGFGALRVPYAAVSRERLGELDVSGVMMVCICGLGLRGSPPHLRFLLRRLRARLPGVPFVLAVCSDDEAGDREALAADDYAGTMEEAVAVCLRTATRAGEADARMMADVFGAQ